MAAPLVYFAMVAGKETCRFAVAGPDLTDPLMCRVTTRNARVRIGVTALPVCDPPVFCVMDPLWFWS
ncbi:hypothetical protein AB0C52_12575 [Streptomyces sp. NPDC048717]|uniref:hypothetical protein n=1 Tax=Streptomyces sp. NPDC048717 TaxID=3154928 RepID=UPI0034353D29